MIPLNLLIGVPHLGEGQVPPYFWGRMLVGTVAVIMFIHLLDRLLRRTDRRGSPPRRLTSSRRWRPPVADLPARPSAPAGWASTPPFVILVPDSLLRGF